MSNRALAATADQEWHFQNSQSRDLLLVFSSVGLVYLSLPGGPMPWLAWVAMVPLGVGLHGKSLSHAFMMTFSVALFGWLTATWWLVPGVALAAGAEINLVLVLELLFCLLYALPYGVAGMLYSRWVSSNIGALKGALLWTAICGLMPHTLPGNLSHSQYLYPPVIQIVDLGGISLLFFVLHWFNFLLVSAALQWRQRKRASLNALGQALLLLSALLIYGILRMEYINTQLEHPDNPHVTVGMVQPNVGLDRRARTDWGAVSTHLKKLTHQAADTGPVDIMVWPEIPTPVSYSEYPEDRQYLQQLTQQTGAPLFLVGHSLSAATGFGKESYFNVAHLLDSRGLRGEYRKQRLMPFGEYLPNEASFPFLRRLLPAARNYQPGDRSVVFDLKPGVRLIPLICYEAVFPKLTYAARQLGGNLIINPVNDAWFGDTAGADFHLALALFRSVEFRIPIVRVTNSGISTVIAPTGALELQSLDQRSVALTKVRNLPIAPVSTLYAETGNLFLYITEILSLVVLLRSGVSRST